MEDKMTMEVRAETRRVVSEINNTVIPRKYVIGHIQFTERYSTKKMLEDAARDASKMLILAASSHYKYKASDFVPYGYWASGGMFWSPEQTLISALLCNDLANKAYYRYKLTMFRKERVARALVRATLTNTTVIGISGKLGSGKDTFAARYESLLKEIDPLSRVVTVSFAEALRQELRGISRMLQTKKGIIRFISQPNYAHPYPEKMEMYMYDLTNMFNCSREDLRQLVELEIEDIEAVFKERGERERKLLQYWGTEVRRRRDNNYWISAVAQKVIMLTEAGFKVIVTDVRFMNELQMIKDLGGEVVRLNVEEEERKRRVGKRDGSSTSKEELMKHSSEVDLDNYKFDPRFVLGSDYTQDDLHMLYDELRYDMIDAILSTKFSIEKHLKIAVEVLGLVEDSHVKEINYNIQNKVERKNRGFDI